MLIRGLFLLFLNSLDRAAFYLVLAIVPKIPKVEILFQNVKSLAKKFHLASRQSFVKTSEILFVKHGQFQLTITTILKFQVCIDLIMHLLLTLDYMLGLLCTIPKISETIVQKLK